MFCNECFTCPRCRVDYDVVISLSKVMHGGLFSEDGVTLDDLRKIERNRQPPDSGIVAF